MTAENTLRTSMEDAPLNRFHKYVLWCTSGGTFCEGYILGIISIALIQIGPQFELTSVWLGAIGAVSLVGAFFGAMIAGPLADRVGRKRVFTTILVAYLVLSIMHFWVLDPMSLLILRFLMGIAVGADFPVSVALLTEFSPRKKRGELLGIQFLFWGIGYAASFAVGYAILSFGPDAWRWMLASSAIPALVTLILRLRMPESPMWLAAHGRLAEAQSIVSRYIGGAFTVAADPVLLQPEHRTSLISMMKQGYAKRLVLVATYLSASVTPQFAIGTFAPSVFSSLGLSDDALVALVSNSFTIVGTLVGMYLVTKMGRKPLMAGGFLVCVALLGMLGVVPEPAAYLIVVCFILYTLVNSSTGVVGNVYSPELFPTHFRASALGWTIAVSRIVSAIGTFLFPVVMASIGIQGTLLLSAAVALVGFLVTATLGVETRGRSLAETGAIMLKRSDA